VALHVRCPECGATYRVADDQAGGTARCPECTTLARIPAPGAASAATASPGNDPGRSPAAAGAVPMPPGYGAWDPAAWQAEAERRVGTHLTIIAILDIVLSVLCLLWGLMCFVAFHALNTGAVPMPPELQDPAVRELALGMYPVLGGLSLVTFLFLLIAGVALVLRRPVARVLGLVAGGICCLSVWQCILFPFCLILGIYSLVILLGQDARLLFAALRGQLGGSPAGAAGTG
jgi:predicted Zn finger-like uncharacterized protein